MEDPNSAVVSCAVNVITELSDKNPKNYLSLAPAFFQLLSRSSNNWMLIKVVKLLGSLVPEEPRLARYVERSDQLPFVLTQHLDPSENYLNH